METEKREERWRNGFRMNAFRKHHPSNSARESQQSVLKEKAPASKTSTKTGGADTSHFGRVNPNDLQMSHHGHKGEDSSRTLHKLHHEHCRILLLDEK
mmetsp:Transcript_27928/g.64696  ORF Transcript_27928/g.64696 Transcript_27928/m.64696 type:complete len:98 (+) Transcript_27928:114-407(+)